MTPAQSAILAHAILFVHLGIIVFNVAGLVAIPLGAWAEWRFVRLRWLRVLHLMSWGVVALQAASGRACFLTIWQNALENRGAEAATTPPMIVSWVNSLVYWPLPLWVFTLIYLALTAYAVLLWWLVRPTGRQSG
jgi:hypothetical protein